MFWGRLNRIVDFFIVGNGVKYTLLEQQNIVIIHKIKNGTVISGVSTKHIHNANKHAALSYSGYGHHYFRSMSFITKILRMISEGKYRVNE